MKSNVPYHFSISQEEDDEDWLSSDDDSKHGHQNAEEVLYDMKKDSELNDQNFLQQLLDAGEEGRIFFYFDIIEDIFLQIFSAIEYIHAKGVVHHDIKPSNILIMTPQDQYPIHCCVCDFGLAEYFDDRVGDTLSLDKTKDIESSIQASFAEKKKDTQHKADPQPMVVGTLQYMAPEVFMQKATLKSDIWSIGVILYEIIYGQKPYTYTDNVLGLFYQITSVPVQFGDETEEGDNTTIALCRKLLSKNEAERPTALDALNMPWLRKKWEAVNRRLAEKERVSLVKQGIASGSTGASMTPKGASRVSLGEGPRERVHIPPSPSDRRKFEKSASSEKLKEGPRSKIDIQPSADHSPKTESTDKNKKSESSAHPNSSLSSGFQKTSSSGEMNRKKSSSASNNSKISLKTSSTSEQPIRGSLTELGVEALDKAQSRKKSGDSKVSPQLTADERKGSNPLISIPGLGPALVAPPYYQSATGTPVSIGTMQRDVIQGDTDRGSNNLFSLTNCIHEDYGV